MTGEQREQLRRLAEKANEDYDWKARHGRDDSEVILNDGIKFGRCVVAIVDGTTTDKPNHVQLSKFIAAAHPQAILDLLTAHDALAAEHEALRRVVAMLEWNDAQYGSPCPLCHQHEQDGHAFDCAIAAALREPRVARITEDVLDAAAQAGDRRLASMQGEG